MVEQSELSALIELVEDFRASVIDAKVVPISVTAAVLSRRDDCGVRGASVASEFGISFYVARLGRL